MKTSEKFMLIRDVLSQLTDGKACLNECRIEMKDPAFTNLKRKYEEENKRLGLDKFRDVKKSPDSFYIWGIEYKRKKSRKKS